jgi:hypothetical protein
MTKTERNPKPEARICPLRPVANGVFARHSDFGLLSSFVIRHSDF